LALLKKSMALTVNLVLPKKSVALMAHLVVLLAQN
jgi:hypothetical protein